MELIDPMKLFLRKSSKANQNSIFQTLLLCLCQEQLFEIPEVIAQRLSYNELSVNIFLGSARVSERAKAANSS